MALTVTQSPQTIHLANNAKFKLQTDDSSSDFFYICMKVLVDENRDGAFSQVGPELKKPADNNNEAEFDIHAFLQKHVTSHFTAYRGNTSINPAANYDYVRKYKIEYYERAGIGQSIISSVNQTSIYRALQGGLTNRKENYYEEAELSFYDEITSLMFLSNAPNIRKHNPAYKGDYMFLYFMPVKDITYYYNINIYSAAGIFTYQYEIPNTEQYEICMLSYDLDKIIQDLSPVFDNVNKDEVYSYFLLVKDSNGEETEKIKVYHNTNYLENIRSLAFNNQYGLMEIIHTEGVFQHQSEYEYVKFQNENDSVGIVEALMKGKVTANTGYISKEMLEYMNELFLSYSTYEVFDDYIQKVHFKGVTLPRPKSDENVYQFSFEYKYDNEHYADSIDTKQEVEEYAWYGFRLIKGQTDTQVTAIGSDGDTIAEKPASSSDMIYPAVVNQSGIVVYKLGGSTGNDLTKKKDSEEASDLTGADGEVMTVFEPFYYSYSTWSDGINTYEDWMFSVEYIPGFKKTPRYFKGIYPAYYDSAKDRLRSVSNVTPTTNKTRAWFRGKAANNGSGWCIEPYFMENIIYHLWVAESLNLNTQEAISAGATNASTPDWYYFCSGKWPVWTSGGEQLSSYADSNGVLNITDPNAADVRNGEIPLSIDNWGDGTKILNTQIGVMFHCREPWGHIWKFKDGINIHKRSENGARVFVNSDPSTFNDDIDVDYSLAGNITEDSGYVSKFLEEHILPVSVNGTYSQHAGDYYTAPSSGWCIATNGGTMSSGSKAGLAKYALNYDSSYHMPLIGARLCKID